MRILIFSDNHGDIDSVKKIISKNKNAERVISLGDSQMKEIELNHLNIIGVKGNYLFEPPFPYELTFEFEGMNFLFTHGHLQGVKMGLTRLYNKAISKNIDIVCFGHTHQPFLSKIDSLIMLNPGSLSDRRSINFPTYATVDIDEKLLEINILTLDGEKIQSFKSKR